MNYFEAIKQSMENLAKDPKTVFLGYNITHGSRAYGTLSTIPLDRCLETPVAENLIIGLAIGMSLEGFHPVVFFERHDFILNSLDSIVNHLEKAENMSDGEFNPRVLIRATVGGKVPFNPGPQHTQDFSEILRKLMKIPSYDLKSVDDILRTYSNVQDFKNSVLLIERKDLYPSK